MIRNRISRRGFLQLVSALAAAKAAGSTLLASGKSQMNKVERVKAAVRGERVDRVPFTCWHHFGPQGETRYLTYAAGAVLSVLRQHQR